MTSEVSYDTLIRLPRDERIRECLGSASEACRRLSYTKYMTADEQDLGKALVNHLSHVPRIEDGYILNQVALYLTSLNQENIDRISLAYDGYDLDDPNATILRVAGSGASSIGILPLIRAFLSTTDRDPSYWREKLDTFTVRSIRSIIGMPVDELARFANISLHDALLIVNCLNPLEPINKFFYVTTNEYIFSVDVSFINLVKYNVDIRSILGEIHSRNRPDIMRAWKEEFGFPEHLTWEETFNVVVRMITEAQRDYFHNISMNRTNMTL